MYLKALVSVWIRFRYKDGHTDIQAANYKPEWWLQQEFPWGDWDWVYLAVAEGDGFEFSGEIKKGETPYQDLMEQLPGCFELINSQE